MKEKIQIAISVIIGLAIIVFTFWQISTWQLSNGWKQPEPTKYCEGYYVDRRFGFDEYVGTDVEEARLLAGENIIYYDTQICH